MHKKVISIQQSSQLKAIAILMMLGLHLFNRDYNGLFQPLIFVGNQPLSYYLSLFCDACVPIFAFVSGYGLYYKYIQNKSTFKSGNFLRLKKLYINFWVVLILFAVILGWVLKSQSHPGSLPKFLLNFTAIDTSYNGAWWFLTIYVLFVLTSSFWFRLFEKVNPYLFFSVLLIVYLVAFYFRIYKTDIFTNAILSYFHRISALYFCTLFQFMVGAFALKYNWHDKVSNYFKKIKSPSLIAIALIVSLIVFHGIIPNFVVAPFTAIGFIFLFLQVKLSKQLSGFLDYMAVHSTNMWLIHMFFYLTFFKDFIYSVKYVIPIYALLVLACLISSYIVKWIESPIKKMLHA